MTLRQLQYLWAVYRHNLNVTAAAKALYSAQPGVSRQLRQLEKELGVSLFTRSGKRLVSLTPAGQRVVQQAQEVMTQLDNIKRAGKEYSHEQEGHLRIATTHTQARYTLPAVIQKFRTQYPDVSLHVNQGTPAQLADLVLNGETDFAIATEGLEHFTELIMLPCYSWNRSVVVPKDHKFANRKRLRIEEVAAQPLVTYVFGFTTESSIANAFAKKNLEPNVVFTATDTDVIKTYVRLGLGIGIIATMAYDKETDNDLIAIPAHNLFEPSIAHIGFRRGVFVRKFLLEFVQLFASHLTPKLVTNILEAATIGEREALLNGIDLPHR